MNRIEGVVSAYNTDPEKPTVTVTATNTGRDYTARIWFDRKFWRGLRIGDTVILQKNKQGEYHLKTLLKIGEGEGLDFGKKFPKPWSPPEGQEDQYSIQ
ncbi:hypothetical protein HOV30_gp018 [Erwinia phage Derbicus]|uniref:Uncharacterized protein n=1 Tax=Erwinia phage Derbicus TaxID=2530027 RepID=A0A482IKP0_9CAUD|nr:hypothetical protein HOV30_gp018 [Erwinia phage Derbicus]QBP07444.1 hypothetical protein DERBICUS_18 [Erwinia phage Derbicus]